MFGATYSPAGAYIADVSPPEKRAANFGLIGVAFGLGFIAGPALGGLLGQSNLRLPFIVCAGLTFLNFLFGLFVMPESLKSENRRAIDWSQANPLGALRAVWRYDAVARLVPIYVASSLAQQGLQSVWVPYTTYRYRWSVADVGISLAIVGLLFAVSQGALVRPMVARFGELRTLVISLVVAAVGMLLFGTGQPGLDDVRRHGRVLPRIGLARAVDPGADVALGAGKSAGPPPGGDDQRDDRNGDRCATADQRLIRVLHSSRGAADRTGRAIFPGQRPVRDCACSGLPPHARRSARTRGWRPHLDLTSRNVEAPVGDG